jgi:hypothetical protein
MLHQSSNLPVPVLLLSVLPPDKTRAQACAVLYEKEAVTCLCVTSRASRTIFSYPWSPLLLLPPPLLLL